MLPLAATGQPGAAAASVAGSSSEHNSAAASATPPTAPWVEVIEDHRELAKHLDAWRQLGAQALEPNVFHEPCLLLPALQMAGAAAGNLLFLLVYVPDKDPARPPRLGAFLPLERRRRYKFLPVRCFRVWDYDHCYLGTPLVHKDCARESLSALFDWLDKDRGSRAIVEWPLSAAEGPVYRELVDLFHRRGTLTFMTDQATRAYFHRRADADTYLKDAIGGNKRRDLNRRQRKLGELGKLEFRVLSGAEIDSGCEDFLRLEASGWKGRQGTALACTAAGPSFFRDAVKYAAQRDQLLLNGLYLNDQPIALRVSFTSGTGSFFFKPAYDERYAQFAPGVLLELETIRLLHAHPTVRWMDSCTSPGNELLNDLWLDRIVLQTLVTATDRGLGRLLVSLLPLLRWFNRKMGRYQGDVFPT